MKVSGKLILVALVLVMTVGLFCLEGVRPKKELVGTVNIAQIIAASEACGGEYEGPST